MAREKERWLGDREEYDRKLEMEYLLEDEGG